MAADPRAYKAPVGKSAYRLRISPELDARLRRFRASVRATIQKQLAEIMAVAAANRRRATVPDQKEPPLRFYVYEGYRIAYQIDSESRRVVVLDIELLHAA